MKQIFAEVSALVAIIFVSTAWAGPIEDVAEIAGPRQQAFQQGNVENYVAAFADNAVFQSSFLPFRIEGKDAIRAFYTQMFQMYPNRVFVVRHPTVRAFGDNLVIQNSYSVLYLTMENGESRTYNNRSNTVWSKIDGRWQIVDQHVSRLPVAQ